MQFWRIPILALCICRRLLQTMGGLRGYQRRCGHCRRHRHARIGSHTNIEGPTFKRTGRSSHPSSHDQFNADDYFPSLLGPWTGRQTGDRLQGSFRRTRKRQQAIIQITMNEQAQQLVSVEPDTVPSTMRGLLVYFLRLGTFGFGGPIALAGYMQRDLVEARGWVSRADYLEGLAFSQLSPGPLAAQLAMYIGWLRSGVIGATLVGAAFVLPSFLMAIVVAALYVHFGSLPWIQGVFYGIGAAVIAIIVRSAIKLVRTTVRGDVLLWTIFVALALTTAVTQSEIIGLFILSGFVALLIKAPLSL